MAISHHTLEKKRTSSKHINKKAKEEAIVVQFRKIQKNYANLIQELIKELDLLKGWLEKKTLKKHSLMMTKLKSGQRKA